MRRVFTTLQWVIVFALVSLGFAQEAAEISTDFPSWFSRPEVGIAAVVGIVHWLRKQFPGIDGPVVVPAVAVVVGALVGAGGQLVQWLTVQPFASWSFPWGGLAYGVSCAVTGVLGVNLFDLVTGRIGKALVGLFTGGGDEPAEASDSRTDAHQSVVRR